MEKLGPRACKDSQASQSRCFMGICSGYLERGLFQLLENDISDTMLDTLFRVGGNSKLTHLYFEAKQEIK